MNKDFWERIDRLEELAHNIPAEIWEYEADNENLKNSYGRRFGVVEVNYGKYIAAANPAMILEMIAEMRRLEKENEELWANNYGPEILNDPQALTTCYFAGRMAEGRERNTKEDKLLDEKERLEKEADWLAKMCRGFCDGHNYCNECVHYPRGCPISKEIEYRFDKHEVEDWRKEARKAISEYDNA